MLTDLDFADDISLLSDTVKKASKLLTEVERPCNRNGLFVNAKKTKVMPINAEEPTVKVNTIDGTQLEVGRLQLPRCLDSFHSTRFQS